MTNVRSIRLKEKTSSLPHANPGGSNRYSRLPACLHFISKMFRLHSQIKEGGKVEVR